MMMRRKARRFLVLMMLDDLSSFDVANGLASSKKVAVKKET